MLSRQFVRYGVSMLAMFASAGAAAAQNQDPNGSVASRPGADNATTPAAQAASDTAPPDPANTAEIVVRGVRASLATAEAIKRTAPQIVDSIVSQDIGKLPDNTVSDALQRVTGVQVTRGAGEAGTVLVRGLPNITTLLNGREAFTGTGRGVALQDIPAELIAGVDVYKTSTSDIIEGGITGTIDVRLRRPFDFDGLQIAGAGRAVYSDQSRKWGYLGSGLVSDRWETSIGDIGVLFGASYNRRRYRDDDAFDFVSNPLAGSNVGIPDTVGGLYTSGNRQRLAFNGSVQWKPADNLEFYVDGLYTQYKNTYAVDFFIGLPKAGTVTATTTYPNFPFLANSSTTTNAYTLTSKQAYQNKTDTYQFNGGGKWTTGHAVLTSELTYNRSRLPGRNVITDTSFNSPQIGVNFDQGGTPRVNLTGVNLTDPTLFSIQTLFDNHSVAVSRQWAWRGDLLYTFDDGFLTNFKVGSRYTTRRATSQATASNPIPIGTPVPVSSISGFASISPGDLVKGALGVGSFVDANTNYLLNNTDAVRKIFGQPAGDRPYDPNLAFFDDEKTYAVYAQAAFAFDLGSIRVDGTAGARIVNTSENLQGNGVSSRENYLNVLPSFNARAKLTDQLQLRVAVAKTLTRPEFAQLNPLVSYTSNGQTGSSGTAFTGGGGNPALQPIKTNAYDVSLEWYPAKATSVTLAGFYKDVFGYIQTYSQIEAYQGQTALVSRPRNTGTGKLYGAEAAYQQFFDFLPGPLSGLGAQLNGTFIKGTTQDPILGGQQRLTNVSKWSYNVVAIYEKYGASVRLAWNWRSSFVDSYNSGGVQAGTIVADPTGQLDLSMNYAVTDYLSLTFDATNLTDRVYHDRFKGVNAVSGLYSSTPRDTRTYDRTFEVGARFKF
ncbi:TonB-dependent receptor [Sphingomonas nostoxanthinifaciens]|uniref:TonB-dependent receptor n=1 Tax=Sphingomonas nostoxanthinifaciens TaxID=2872652 RepID=UPI001CC1C2E9|nr:TonB-dependent receptor [Sphingomonas nostoxanthinifaciens]UAK26073.1 TonB-dependent receptor [Sphingomonas nostoxanthinifaciens]